MNVAIVLFDGFDNLDAIGPFEVFHHARRTGGDLEVGLYTTGPQAVVTSSHGLRVQPDGWLVGELSEDSTDLRQQRLSERPDLVIVPGGNWSDHEVAGTWAEVQSGAIPDVLERLYEDGVVIASVCTGAMLLAAAGLTNGRPAVTHHGAIEDLRQSGAEVVEARVVNDGDIVTAGGVTAGIDLALHLVEREFGEEIAHRVASEMEYEKRGDVYER